MGKPSQIWRRLLCLLKCGQLERELREEMRIHAHMKAEKNMAAGLDYEAAHTAAKKQLGNVMLLQEQSREQWGFTFLESIFQDLRYGSRGLRNSPGFSAVALLTLALGIGATTAIFSIVYAVLLRPLPFKDSQRIVSISTVSSMFPEFRLGQAIPNLNDIKARAKSFENIATYQLKTLTLTGSGEPEEIAAAGVSSNFLDVFSVHPMMGRAFLPSDEQHVNGDVVLLSHQLWREQFASDPRILGTSVMLDQKPYTVVGVLPQSADRFYLRGDDKTGVLVPLAVKPEDQRNRTAWMYLTVAKLRKDVPLSSAQAELDAIAAALAQQYPKEDSQVKFPVMNIRDEAVGGDKRGLLILLVAVGFLLLIACANVSNLVLSRGLKRQREIALRAALGASRRRIVRQLLLESLLLAIIGGAAGVALAAAGITAFRAFAPAGFPRLEEIRFEPQIALFAFAFSLLAAALCGLAPALAASRSDLNPTIRENSVAAPAGRPLLRGFLVVTEVALALMLLTGSALMVQSLVRTLRVDPGLRTDHLATARVTLSSTRYPTEDAQILFTKRLLDALRAQPQFSGVALSNNSILSHSSALMTFDPSLLGFNEREFNLEARSASPGFFSTMGIPLLRGRDFTDRDTKGSPDVVVINDSMAKRFFPGQDPVGKIIRFSRESKEQYQIVGVVADTRDVQLNSKPRPEIYYPILQNGFNETQIMVRSALDSAAVTALVQKCLWSVDKDEPLRDVSSMTEVISRSVAEPRFRTWLLTAFAAAGLALTLIGIYGVISYSVAQQTREIGIRIALGAQPGNMRRLVLNHGLRLTVLGAAVGVAGSLLLMRVLANQLYEVKPGDPATLISAAAAMLAVAVAACYLPARRATQVDPMIALRCE
jgi:putative ABC transport system permease protein